MAETILNSKSANALPENWRKSAKAVRAVQVAFDLDEKLQKIIRDQAYQNSLSPSDQIRSILNLPIAKRPKRPRLTASFSAKDYQQLATKYGLQQNQALEIKQRVMQDLIDFVRSV